MPRFTKQKKKRRKQTHTRPQENSNPGTGGGPLVGCPSAPPCQAARGLQWQPQIAGCRFNSRSTPDEPPPPLPSTHTWTSISRSRSPLRSPFCLQNATYITDCPPDTFRIPFAPPASSLFAPLHTRASTDPLLRRSVTPLGLGAGPPGLSLRPPTLPTLPTRLFFVPVCDALHDAYSVPVGEATAVRTSYGALRTAAKVRVRWLTAARRLSAVQGPVSARVSR